MADFIVYCLLYLLYHILLIGAFTCLVYIHLYIVSYALRCYSYPGKCKERIEKRKIILWFSVAALSVVIALFIGVFIRKTY